MSTLVTKIPFIKLLNSVKIWLLINDQICCSEIKKIYIKKKKKKTKTKTKEDYVRGRRANFLFEQGFKGLIVIQEEGVGQFFKNKKEKYIKKIISTKSRF
jgi:hypothetical protein